VKIAEEEAQVHARKNLEAEEEIRRVRASAVKVGFSIIGYYCSYLQCHCVVPVFQTPCVQNIVSDNKAVFISGIWMEGFLCM